MEARFDVECFYHSIPVFVFFFNREAQKLEKTLEYMRLKKQVTAPPLLSLPVAIHVYSAQRELQVAATFGVGSDNVRKNQKNRSEKARRVVNPR